MEHTTKVVNIRYDQYDVYIGRPGKGEEGYFGNPILLKNSQTKGSTIDEFRKYFYNRIENDLVFKQRVEVELLNKRLGCFCKQKEITNPTEIQKLIKTKNIQCHGDIYVEYFNNLKK